MKIQEVMKLQRKALGITQQDLADMSEIAIFNHQENREW